ncbi:GntR family transcriptional regulator [Pseudophaeobacter flagellatus]|uniref:GntR family transcriptional regulator n=1 Tax=Pseudophaeobacter flagellatus TaxID=2899119 RepID=UPI001E37648A|nr:GntR family transcriptional regulator [Pseudophaeobacter flagellatus]MCD9150127.1 GntR family transcriptional regulator [Pseudophaeobacter flagellatus]
MYKSSTRSFPVYDSLRQAIIEQALKPGVKLPEDSIGETFGVSRTTVRNALVRLDAEGLVDLQPNRGASVAEPTIEEAYDIFEMRQCLEREVIQRLCKMDPKPIVKTLKAHLKEEEKYLGKDSTRSIRLAGEFHILLAELTGSKILANYVNEIVSRCSLILARFAQVHSAECGVEEHAELIAALAEGDAERANACMHSHLHGVQDRALLNPEDAQSDNVAAILSRYRPTKTKP